MPKKRKTTTKKPAQTKPEPEPAKTEAEPIVSESDQKLNQYSVMFASNNPESKAFEPEAKQGKSS